MEYKKEKIASVLEEKTFQMAQMKKRHMILFKALALFIAFSMILSCLFAYVKVEGYAATKLKNPSICLDRYDGDVSWLTAKGNTFITEYGEILFSIYEHKTGGGYESWKQRMDNNAKTSEPINKFGCLYVF